MKLTVYHDGQFWVGVFEEIVDQKLKVFRHVFGAEPKDEEILELINKKMLAFTDWSSQFVEAEEPVQRRTNPKRLSREVSRAVQEAGISTKAQQALQLERDKNKTERKVISRQQKEELAEKKRNLKKEKAKQRHRGK